MLVASALFLVKIYVDVASICFEGNIGKGIVKFPFSPLR